MKIAITAHGDNRHGAVDSRFLQADYFVLYDQERNTWDSLSHAKHITSTPERFLQTGQELSNIGVKVLITGHIGPKAFKMLQAEQITIYSLGEMNNTSAVEVEEVLLAFLSGRLMPIIVPNALDLKKQQRNHKN